MGRMGRDALSTIEQDGSVDQGVERRGSDVVVGFWGRPPRLWFHLAVSAAALLALWSVSSPGFALVPLLGAIGALWLLSLVWLARAIAFGTSRHDGPVPPDGSPSRPSPVSSWSPSWRATFPSAPGGR